jgi:hypothetical protein
MFQNANRVIIPYVNDVMADGQRCEESDEDTLTIAEPQEYDGLCMNCIHAGACVYRRQQNQPVLSCNEHDTGTVQSKKPTAKMTTCNRDEQDCDPLKGLCSNCENRKTCMLPKPVSGVWHCEEYR